MKLRQIPFLLTTLGLALATRAHAQGVLLDAIAPATASYGESVTLRGTGFGGPGVRVRVGRALAPVVSATGTYLTFRVPTGVPIGPTSVTVTNPGRRAASIAFEVSSRVSLVFDDVHRANATIGPEGGVVGTQSNGRTFTLTIPPGALAAPETIVLTPIADMFGFPLDRLLGAVHFAPEGLQFLQPATLTIALPPDANTRGLIGISAAGNGENLHLAPFTLTGDHAISLPIPHFTIGGAGGGSAAASDTVNCQQATLECRYVNALARAYLQAEQSVCGTDCESVDDLADHLEAITDAAGAAFVPLFDQWFGELLELVETAGVASDEGLATEILEFQAWHSRLQVLPCSFGGLCIDVPLLADDLARGRAALAQAYAAALQRGTDGCNDRRVYGLWLQIEQLLLYGLNGLPVDLVGVRERYACQLVITPSFPASVTFDEVVPFSVAIGVRDVGGAGGETPRPGLLTSLEISDGCGEFEGGGRLKTASTDANGTIATNVKIVGPCVGAANATEIRVTVPVTIDRPTVGVDIENALGEVEVLSRTATVRATFGVEIVVTPQNASVNPDGSVTFTAQVTGAGPLVHWTASGGSITPGPSATAIYTAGSSPGVFGVTATSVDEPTESQTVAVTIQGGEEEDPITLSGLEASLTTESPGACFVQYDQLFGFDSTCPAGTWSAPPDFTWFGEQRSLFSLVEEKEINWPPGESYVLKVINGVQAEHYAEIGSDEIRSSGFTSAWTGGHTYTDENGESAEYFPGSHAGGSAELRVRIEIRGEPAEYQLEGIFYHDNYPWNSALGSAQVKLQFADQNFDFSGANAGLPVEIPTTYGTLLPGIYELKFTAESDAVKNVSGGIGFHTRWRFRLRIH